MRPVCLQLKGFTSFKEETTVSFAHLDRFAVCGPTGAGKSSLFDALTFALFADAPRVDTGNNADLISLGRKSFAVSFDFAISERTYRVMRTRSRAGGEQPDQLLELGRAEPLATGARPVTAAVEKLLGLSYEHFTQSVFLPQGKFAELLRSRPGVRRKLLNELLRLLVYERMREGAGQEREGAAARKEETERRLREDFGNVSAEARAELGDLLAEQQRILAEANRKLPSLRLGWEEARCNQDWTAELETRQLEWTRQAARQPEIDQAQREAEAAQLAAEVMPALQQADAAIKALGERQASLQEAAVVRDQRRAEHDQARKTHTKAAREAAPLPEMRDLLQRLSTAVGMLPLCDKLNQEIEQHQSRHQALLAQRSRCTNALGLLTNAGKSLETSLADADVRLAQIGYDLQRHQRLEKVRDESFRLRSDRERLEAALQQARQDEERLDKAERTVSRAEADEAAAKNARQQTQETFADAERQLRAAEDAHKAVHLRAALIPGQPCPVCLHNVGELPLNEPAPELAQRQREFEASRGLLTQADAAIQLQSAKLIAAHTAADNLRLQAQTSRAGATQRQQAIDQLQHVLLEKVGDILQRNDGRHSPAKLLANPRPAAASFLAWTEKATPPAAPPRRRGKNGAGKVPAVPHALPANGLFDQPQAKGVVAVQEMPAIEPAIEELILAALQVSAQQAEEHRQAAQCVAELRNALVLKRKERETLLAEGTRLDQDVHKTIDKLTQDQRALAETRAEIHAAAGTNDPVSESTRVHQEIDRLQHLQAEAAQIESETSKNWQIAEAHCTACADELAGAKSHADETARLAQQSLARAGFNAVDAVRHAFRTPQVQQALRDRIAEHAAVLQALSQRIAELDKSLQGRRVSREECRQCEQAHNDCLQIRQEAQTQTTLLTGQLATMSDRLERAHILQGELSGQEQRQRIYEQLSRDLRSDHFQAFLLEETLAGLVRDASEQLQRLTGERYGLHFEDDRIFVVDNDNAAELRGIETLSGGETFLASLALALALSDQVQKIAGAVHLDCLFIDEGFGALDPETLRTVSDTIRALQVGGRMVGVITHVPELKEEFDQRLVVERKEGTSQVRVEIC